MDIFANYQQAYEKMYNITNHQGNQIKTTVRNHLAAVRMATVRKTSNSKCWRGYGEKGALVHCWKVGQLGAHTGTDRPWSTDMGEARDAEARSGGNFTTT